jgi:small conductance mechanosensitive channel
VVPNSEVFGKTIDNYSGYGIRRVDVKVGCDYSADLDATRKALEKAFQEIPRMLSDPAPQVFLAGLGESSIDWQVRVWCNCDDYWPVWESAVRATKRALDSAGITIPFPQRDVHFDEPVVRALGK